MRKQAKKEHLSCICTLEIMSQLTLKDSLRLQRLNKGKSKTRSDQFQRPIVTKTSVTQFIILLESDSFQKKQNV